MRALVSKHLAAYPPPSQSTALRGLPWTASSLPHTGGLEARCLLTNARILAVASKNGKKKTLKKFFTTRRGGQPAGRLQLAAHKKRRITHVLPVHD